MDMAALFADISVGLSGQFNGPYWSARIIRQTDVAYDDGGSIIPGTGGPVYRGCMAQCDTMSDAMQKQDGYADKDQRILVLAATLDGAIDTDDRIELLAGPFRGVWDVKSVGRDTFAAYHELRGRGA